MRSVAVFLSLSRGDRRLLLRAVMVNVVARVALYVRSLDGLRAWSSRRGPMGRYPLNKILWAGLAVAERMPGATCLSSSLALQRLLSSNGYVSELHIGVARQGGAFFAHAWVEYEGRILIGEDDERSYTRLASWVVGRTMAPQDDAGSGDRG